MRSLSSIILEKCVREEVRTLIKSVPEKEIMYMTFELEGKDITFESSLEKVFEQYPDLVLPAFNDNYSKWVMKYIIMNSCSEGRCTLNCCINSDLYGRRINFGTKEDRELFSDIWACEVNAYHVLSGKGKKLYRLHNKDRAYEYIKSHPMEFSETLVMYASGTLQSNENKIPGRIMFDLESVEEVV